MGPTCCCLGWRSPTLEMDDGDGFGSCCRPLACCRILPAVTMLVAIAAAVRRRCSLWEMRMGCGRRRRCWGLDLPLPSVVGSVRHCLPPLLTLPSMGHAAAVRGRRDRSRRRCLFVPPLGTKEMGADAVLTVTPIAPDDGHCCRPYQGDGASN
ncbi:hypothetical protein ACLOJK_038995 [Asimina triloba]